MGLNLYGEEARSMYLSRIASPDDVKVLDRCELPLLCSEIREAIIASSAAVGGHVGPNLGSIELTVALHRVFNSPHDKIIFDVSHQTYAHKALTGRARAYLDPAHYNEVSGFSNPTESEHDLFAMGHTSTSIGLALGMACARDLAHDTYDVVAIIGDGSLSCGLAFEGLDNAADYTGGLIIIVNDNEQSIAENHGGLYRNLAELRASRGTAPNNLFRALGLDYRYVGEGNDVLALVDAFEKLRGCDHPVVVHVHTRKGMGFAPAERDPEGWHHVGPFDRETGQKLSSRTASAGPDYAELTAAALISRMQDDENVIAITAATPYIMGFTPQRRAQAGRQFVDVGIAEEHAVTFAAALARAGAKPVLGIYGTFLQRAYDQLWHDVCLNGTPATILVFGASVFGTTDQTHLGYFDISMLGNMPGLRYLAPTGPEEYLAMLAWSLDQRDCPVAIRVPVALPYPAAALPTDAAFDAPAYQTVRTGSRIAILALGDFFVLGEQLAAAIEQRAGIVPTLVNPRFVTELDKPYLTELARTHDLIITLEDGVLEGGWGEKIARYLSPLGTHVRCHGVHIGFPDRYVPQELLAENGMTVDAMAEDALRLLGTIE